jgi:dipeptidyl aminopeptidase/acylaminoacyl peptidase
VQLEPGTSLAHYEIGELLGKGGMGEVYRARDGRLGREVAIKLLPEEFTRDVERLARFEREARLLASLSHSHIASIHGIEDVEGSKFLVMELADGGDLSERIAAGPIDVEEATEIAKQIAEALEAAHAQGIVHRDLKPGNIKVDDNGTVKVLDFGLAKAMDLDEDDRDISDSPTMMKVATNAGMIIGTAAYMSPEQARGRKVDRRADIWAFGVVLWEMLTGKKLFEGETASDTLAAVLRQEIDWNELPGDTPAFLVRILRRCLERRLRSRQQDIGDVRLDLEAGNGDFAASAGDSKQASARFLGFLPLVLPVAALVAFAVIYFRPEPESPPAPVRKFKITDTASWVGFSTGRPRISPDGRYVAYLQGRLFIRPLARLEAFEVPDTDGVRVAFWSPDSRWLGFVDDNKVFKVPAEGGSVVPVGSVPTDLFMLAAAWGADDRIVLAQWRGGLWEMSARGGSAKVLLPPDEELVDYHSLAFLPDGRSLLVEPHMVDDSGALEVIRGSERKRLSRQFMMPSVDPSGYIIHTEDEDNKGVWATPFAIEKGEITGESFILAPGAAAGDVSADGTLVYVRDAFENRGQLVRVDRSGRIVEEYGEAAESIRNGALSPDENRIVFTMEEEGNDDLWLLDLRRGTRTRITFFPEAELDASWSPDGKSLVFVRHVASDWEAEENGIFLMDLGSAEKARKLVRGSGPEFFPDGSGIIYETFDVRGNVNLATISLADGASPKVFLESEFETDHPSISPDGRFVVYESNETGTNQVFMTRFPSGEGKWQVSTDGGSDPEWSRDGKKIYYANGGRIFEVDFSEDPEPLLGVPSPFFTPSVSQSLVIRNPGSGVDIDLSYRAGYVPLPDGESILALRSVPSEDGGVVVVENWRSEFEDRP